MPKTNTKIEHATFMFCVCASAPESFLCFIFIWHRHTHTHTRLCHFLCLNACISHNTHQSKYFAVDVDAADAAVVVVVVGWFHFTRFPFVIVYVQKLSRFSIMYPVEQRCMAINFSEDFFSSIRALCIWKRRRESESVFVVWATFRIGSWTVL